MLKKFKDHADLCKDDGFVCYMWSNKVIKRKNQVFAVFGTIAYDVTKMKFNDPEVEPGSGKLCVPIKGRYLAQIPEEGRSGVLGCYIVNKKDRAKRPIYPTFISCGWLHSKELKLSNEEIENNIIDDVLEGKNVFTNKPAGWV